MRSRLTCANIFAGLIIIAISACYGYYYSMYYYEWYYSLLEGLLYLLVA
jgi:hypothetical protein